VLNEVAQVDPALPDARQEGAPCACAFLPEQLVVQSDIHDCPFRNDPMSESLAIRAV
jgi:hypothetical protein